MNFLLLVAYLWQRRFVIVVPVVFFTAVGLMWSWGHAPYFSATTVLNLDGEEIDSPLVRDVQDRGHLKLLRDTLTSNEVVEDTMIETGLLLQDAARQTKESAIEAFKKRIEVEALADGLVRVSYRSLDSHNIDHTLEVLIFNFINEILTPERFRIQQKLSALEAQVKRYNARKKMLEREMAEFKMNPVTDVDDKEALQAHIDKIVSMEFDVQRLGAQQELAQQEFTKLVARSKHLFNNYDRDSFTSVMWFVDPPKLVTGAPEIEQHIAEMKRGAWFGLIVAFVLMFIGAVTDKSVRSDRAIAEIFGDIKILGRLPNLGKVTQANGSMTIEG